MKKTGALLIVAMLLMMMAAMAAEKNMGAPTLVIPGGKNGDVSLPHELHQAVLGDCTLCHQLFPQEAGVIVQLKDAGTLRKMQVMKQCQNCHKERAKAGQKAGPVKCAECHKKE